MTAQIRSSLRAVILPSPDAHPSDTPTRRLLGDLGLDALRANSPDHAMTLLDNEPTDLLVVDVTNNSQNRNLFADLVNLPESRRPQEIAVFSDSLDGQLRELRRNISPSKVHVFLKPLHMHGLLGVLRQIEKRHAAEDSAKSGFDSGSTLMS